ncbi:MAG: hypothetical protein QMD80_01165 [archaeon]|nr:hypothetical protein [archaeon]MDI6884852.1 hypothetical protein [archaeon]
MALIESHQKIITKIIEIIKNTVKDDFNLDILADGTVIYGKEVLDRGIFKRYDIRPILKEGVRIGWRVPA